MPIILPTQTQDLDIAETYAVDVFRRDPKKRPEAFYAGALGELAFARWDAPQTYERCLEHLRRATAPTHDDWRYDFVSKASYLIDVKTVGYDNVCQGFGDLLVSKPDEDVTYVLLHSLGPSGRIFEFVGWMLGSQILDEQTGFKSLARDNHKFVRVPKGKLNLVTRW
jgi:hypothetical protein